MEKFCGNCGSKLNENTGVCPVCDKKANKKALRKLKKTEKKKIKKQKKKEKWIAKTLREKVCSIILKIVVIALILLLMLFGIFGALVYKGVVKVTPIDTLFEILEFEEKYEVKMLEADEYYEKNSTIIEKVSVKDSKKIYDEKEVFELLNNRGFTEYEIKTEYSLDGEYYDAVSISSESEEKHPSYSVYYVSDNDMIWNVTVVNDTMLAIPISYNMEQEASSKVIISESEYITSYDNVTNMFYVIEPKENLVQVISVEKIDERALDQLTSEKIESLK